MRQPRTDRPADAPAPDTDAARADTADTASATAGDTLRLRPSLRAASGNRGRLYALGLLVLAIAVGYGIGLHWWWTSPMLTMGRQMDELREQELRFRMLAGQKPEIEKRLAQLRQVEQDNPAFLPEDSAELAQAGLTQRIESEVGAVSPDHGACNITQRTPIPANGQERYQRVTVQVRLLCGMNEFSALLHAFEGGRPQLFVTNLNIIGRISYGANGVPQSGGPLDISFDVYGYLRPGVSGAATTTDAAANGGENAPN